MGYIGKNKHRNISGNKPKKSTFIYHLEQEEISGELEYNQLVLTVNEYYDNLIKSIQEERGKVVHELEQIFLFKSSTLKERIASKEIDMTHNQNFDNPLPEYLF